MLFALAISACACTPIFAPGPGTPDVEMPETFSLYAPQTGGPARWWETFHDPELDALIDGVLAGNLDLRQAMARLRQARAAAVRAGAALVPDLTVDGDAGLKRQRTDSGDTAAVQSGDTYAVGLVSRWESDLWGRIHSEMQAAGLEAAAGRETVAAMAVTLAAEAADRWVRILSARMNLGLLRRQLETNRVYLSLVELRFRKGMVSALDVYQQRQAVERVAARIPVVEKNQRLLLHELALLLGKPAGVPIAITRDRIPELSGLPVAGIPADLLASRPDIRSAGMKLRAAEWQLSAARANRLPSLSLSASAGLGPGRDADLVFDNWLLRLAASLAAPLLDGHRRKAEVDRSLAVVDENLAGYRETVYTAIKEVEDTLVTEAKLRQHIQALGRQFAAAGKALEEARERYRKGLSTYLPVLTQLLSVQGLEENLLEQETALVRNRIGLYRALGGNWPDLPVPDEPEIETPPN